VTTRRFEDACLDPCFFERFLKNGFVKMMPAIFSGYPVSVVTRRRKHPLPSPLFARVWVSALIESKPSTSSGLRINVENLAKCFRPVRLRYQKLWQAAQKDLRGEAGEDR